MGRNTYCKHCAAISTTHKNTVLIVYFIQDTVFMHDFCLTSIIKWSSLVSCMTKYCETIQYMVCVHGHVYQLTGPDIHTLGPASVITLKVSINWLLQTGSIQWWEAFGLGLVCARGKKVEVIEFSYFASLVICKCSCNTFNCLALRSSKAILNVCEIFISGWQYKALRNTLSFVKHWCRSNKCLGSLEKSYTDYTVQQLSAWSSCMPSHWTSLPRLQHTLELYLAEFKHVYHAMALWTIYHRWN